METAKSQWVSQYRYQIANLLTVLKELRELRAEAVALDYVTTLTNEDCSGDNFDVTVQNMVEAVGSVDAVEAALAAENRISKLYTIARRN